MGIVTLVSGGLDSTVLASLIKEEGLQQFPLFVDYGQKARDREFAACRASMLRLGLGEPQVAQVPGFGLLIRSGLTDSSLDTLGEAFTPGRNALFLLLAASYAMTTSASAVAIGLLDERFHLFPDQTKAFLDAAEEFFYRALGNSVKILAPLMTMSKTDVVQLARERDLLGTTYSCHEGGEQPCGHCIACREFEGTGV